MAAMACAFLVVLAGCGGEGDGTGLPSPTRTPSVEPTRTPTRTPALPSGSPGASDTPEASALPSESATSPSTPSTPSDSTPSSPEASDGPTPSRTPTERPSRSPDRTPRPTATITVTDSPTSTPTPTLTPTPTTDAPSTAPASEPPASADAETDAEMDAETDDTTDDGVPTWLWWVLGAVALLLAIGVPLLVRHRRRASWAADLAASEAEVAWFGRQLVPELRHDLGAWTASNAARVTEAEDQLTALASRGRDDTDRARALELRDAVRRARQDVEAMTTTPGPAQEALDAVQTRIETALGD